MRLHDEEGRVRLDADTPLFFGYDVISRLPVPAI